MSPDCHGLKDPQKSPGMSRRPTISTTRVVTPRRFGHDRLLFLICHRDPSAKSGQRRVAWSKNLAFCREPQFHQLGDQELDHYACSQIGAESQKRVYLTKRTSQVAVKLFS